MKGLQSTDEDKKVKKGPEKLPLLSVARRGIVITFFAKRKHYLIRFEMTRKAAEI